MLREASFENYIILSPMSRDSKSLRARTNAIPHTGWGKSRLTVVSMRNTEFILVLLFINYYIVFHMNNH